MAHVVRPNDRWLYRAMIEAMHRQRYDIAVEQWGWKIPDVRFGYDKDEFDTDDTVYLLEICPATKQLIGSVRLNPTTKPHMMSEVFPDLCDIKGVPTGPDIWEGSRFILDHTVVPKEQFNYARIRLSAAMTNFCIQEDIASVTWMTHEHLYNMALKRWSTQPLGVPKYFEADQSTYIAAKSEMTVWALDGLRSSLPPGDTVMIGLAGLDLAA